MELRDQIIAEIKKIYDPEIPVNIYELGLIYDIIIDDNLIKLRRKYQNEKKKKNECKKEAKSSKMDRLENG